VLIFIEAPWFLVVIKYDYCFRRLKAYKRKADMSRMQRKLEHYYLPSYLKLYYIFKKTGVG